MYCAAWLAGRLPAQRADRFWEECNGYEDHARRSHGQGRRKLQDFYSKLFDWTVDANNSMNYGMVGVADAGVGIGSGGTE